MGYLRYGVLGTIVIGGEGTYTSTSILADMAEHDLTRIGQGTPTMVQIHDPDCPDCTRLQAETRPAMRSFDDDQFTYLVANLTSAEGASFAHVHSVGRVTLLSMDADGRPDDIVNGVLPHDALRLRFERFLKN